MPRSLLSGARRGTVPSRSLPRGHPSAAALAAALGVEPAHLVALPRSRLPTSDEGLPAFLRWFSDWGRGLPPGRGVIWIQPKGSQISLTLEEAEQILGHFAGVRLLEEDRVADGSSCLIAGGITRSTSIGFGVHWRLEDLRSDASGSLAGCPAAVRQGIHFVEVPAGGAGEDGWREGVGALLEGLQQAPGEGTLGLLLESLPPPDDLELLGRLGWLRDRCASFGLAGAPRCLWIERVSGIGESASIIEFARKHGIEFDFFWQEGEPEGNRTSVRPRPYSGDGAYHALPFDMRTPRFGPGERFLVEVPALSCGSLGGSVAAGDGLVRLLAPLWRRSFPRIVQRSLHPDSALPERLIAALDRKRRGEYLRALEEDRSRVSEWHRYHVYNWRPAPGDWVHLFVCRSAGSAGGQSPWGGRLGSSGTLWNRGGMLVDGATILQRFREQAEERSSSTPAQVIREQISAHGYLKEGGREEITNDSMRLIEELPERLGATLEIGFGYGLTARRVAARATRYVGIDLQVEQCQTLRELGGEGAVADLHRLPFKDGSFDTVIADNVLEHAYDPLAALTEIRRALRRGGRVYSLLPLDGRTSLHQIRSHLWKADEEGIDEAVRRAGLRMLRKQILEYGKLGVYGCFPASEGKTCLMVLEREASIESMPPPPKGAP